MNVMASIIFMKKMFLIFIACDAGIKALLPEADGSMNVTCER